MEILIIFALIIGAILIYKIVVFIQQALDYFLYSQRIEEEFLKIENFDSQLFLKRNNLLKPAYKNCSTSLNMKLKESTLFLYKIQKDYNETIKKHYHRGFSESEQPVRTAKEMSDIFTIK